MKKILLIRLSAFGDIIHTLPALCALRDSYPQAEIHWLVSRKCASILTDHPEINRLHLLEASFSGYREMRRILRDESFDVSIDFQGLIKSASLGWLSGASRRIGRSRSACRERAAALFYTEQVQPQTKHVITQNLELLSPLGVKTDRPLAYRLALPEMEIPPVFGERPVGINIGGGWPTKRYPIEKWAELAREIPQRFDRTVVIFWGPGEEEDARRIQSLAPRSVLAPKTTYREMARLLTHCELLVSSDTGPLHLSVAVGRPTVCLISVTDPERNGPLDPRSRIVLPPPPHEWSYRRTGPNPTERIAVEDILNAINEILKQDGPAQ